MTIDTCKNKLQIMYSAKQLYFQLNSRSLLKQSTQMASYVGFFCRHISLQALVFVIKVPLLLKGGFSFNKTSARDISLQTK